MEYFVGAFVTLVIWVVASNHLNKKYPAKNTKKVVYRQSHLFELIKPAIPYMPREYKKLETQATRYIEQNSTRIFITDGEAYWIADNSVFCAKVDENGIDDDSKKVVDTMTMDDVQLKKITFIVDKLTGGSKQ